MDQNYPLSVSFFVLKRRSNYFLLAGEAVLKSWALFRASQFWLIVAVPRQFAVQAVFYFASKLALTLGTLILPYYSRCLSFVEHLNCLTKRPQYIPNF